MQSLPTLESVLTCPHCGFAARETMPTDACLFFYECTRCHVVLRPNPGHCCVFCSFGSVKCPPVQQELSCCTGRASGES
ncbi:MAG TPA: GDCCVxC domain-containing (seleno)protein [Caldimonas sp.]